MTYPLSKACSPKDKFKKRSWASVVQNRPSLTKHELQVTVVDGSEMVVVPDDVLGDTPLWEDFLVGRFLSTAPHVAKIHVILNQILATWRQNYKVSCSYSTQIWKPLMSKLLAEMYTAD